ERKAMSKDNALAFIGQIMTEHKAVLKADGDDLKHAIECGKALNLAKENVLSTKPKGKWLRWLEEHCPDIHRNTAALYMRLAENEDKIADCTSIRDADVKLRQPNGESDSDSDESDADEVTDDEADEAAQRVVQAGDSDDLADLLQALAVDELYTVLTRSRSFRRALRCDWQGARRWLDRCAELSASQRTIPIRSCRP